MQHRSDTHDTTERFDIIVIGSGQAGGPLSHRLADRDGKERRSTEGRLIPDALFTEPELGRVGLSERDARTKGLDIKVGKIPMRHVARAIEMQRTEGLMKIVVDAKTDRILRAAVLGPSGGEVVQTLMALMMVDAPWTTFHRTMTTHPTVTEGFFGLMNSVA